LDAAEKRLWTGDVLVLLSPARRARRLSRFS
jgi:hypothetical protein